MSNLDERARKFSYSNVTVKWDTVSDLLEHGYKQGAEDEREIAGEENEDALANQKDEIIRTLANKLCDVKFCHDFANSLVDATTYNELIDIITNAIG